jgi:hypothetical protein
VQELLETVFDSKSYRALFFDLRSRLIADAAMQQSNLYFSLQKASCLVCT